MARFHSANTRAELGLRQAVRARGISGYRVNVRALPGCPDIAFSRWRLAVFVDGEFWHGHPSAFQFGTKGEYWDWKIRKNQLRDGLATAQLEAAGWTVLRLWDRDVRRDFAGAACGIAEVLRSKGHPAA
jgi:DNA mismatch endonuclease, patch repair protein